MKAVILAAGEGKRLRPLTVNRPKPMIQIANKPILEYVVKALADNNVRDIKLVVGYKKELIMSHFQDGKRWGVNIEYIHQDKQLGTAHALWGCRNFVKEPFIVLPGDNVIDADTIKPMVEAEDEWGVIISESATPSKYGVVSTDGKPITHIVEKPEREMSNIVSTGICRFPPRVFETLDGLIKAGENDLTTLLQEVIKQGEKVMGVRNRGKWMDAVYPWDVLGLNAVALKELGSVSGGKVEPNVNISGPVTIGKDTILRSGTYILGPTVIGEGCDIGPNVCLLPSTTLGNNVTIRPFTEIRHSVIMDDVYIGSSSYLSHSVIMNGCQLGNHFVASYGEATIITEDEVFDLKDAGTMMGEDCKIGNNVVVGPGVIIGTNCRIHTFKHITSSIEDNSTVM